MLPLVDIHCHLLAGLDDGPRTLEEAVRMCRLSRDEGVQLVAATAHQNDRYPDVTPQRVRQATQQLAEALRSEGLALTVRPSAEVMAAPDLGARWPEGAFLSVADRGQYVLLEMPHGQVVDLLPLAGQLRDLGVRPIFAHPERYPDLLYDTRDVEGFIELGGLVQVTSASVTRPADRRQSRALKEWFTRGLVHLLGSDGHSPVKRPPLMADAYRQVASWAGVPEADRVCSTNGLAVLNGRLPDVPKPRPKGRFWFFLSR